MDESNAYKNLNFSLPNHRISPHILTVAIAFAGFTVMWWAIPASAFYWLFAPIFILLVWMASYGWRTAVTNLVKFLQLIEKL